MTPPDSGERCVICSLPATRGLREADTKHWCNKHGPFYDKPHSGEREVSTAGCAHKPNWLTCELCNAALSVSIPLSLAQRILAALERTMTGDSRDDRRAIAAELGERLPK